MSPQPFAGAMTASFNEPSSQDPTSAPVVPDSGTPGSQISAPKPQNIISQTLAKRKKGFGPGIKNPGALAQSIQNRARARAARPNQTSDKWGAP